MRILVTILAFNEGQKLRDLVSQFPNDHPYSLLFIDDGSTDGCADFLKQEGREVIRHDTNRGVGAGIRAAIKYGTENGHDVIVVMAGNGKMQAGEIPRLLEPIESGRADYVQGSRYLAGGASPNLPKFRGLGIKLFTMFCNVLLGSNGTDVTCGFRAYRLDLFDKIPMNLDQEWLDKYELEYYIHYKAVKGGARVVEVPVSMVYPAEGKNYTKIRPIIGWWSMIRPWVYLTLRVRK
jgi:dolichol-phosphate mannosyltransferase